MKRSHELWVEKPSLQEAEPYQLMHWWILFSPLKSSEMKASKNTSSTLKREGKQQKSILPSLLFYLTVQSKQIYTG